GVFDAAAGTLVQGNYIGIDPSGTVAVPNGDEGVLVQHAPQATVGGAAPAGNVISGNLGDGVGVIGADTAGLVSQGNMIGTDSAGAAPLGNADNGIYVQGTHDVLVGGTGAGNVISANHRLGIGVFGGATGVRIQANRIGIGSDGTAVGNRSDGIYIQDSS